MSLNLTHPSFIIRCAALTDSELCDWIIAGIEDTPGSANLRSHQVVQHVWAFHGFAESAGLPGCVCSYYFENKSLAEVAEAYETVGLPDKAEVLWRLHDITLSARKAGTRPPGNIHLFQGDADLIRFMKPHISWDSSEDVIYRDPFDFVRRVATFIRANLGDFESMPLEFKPIHRDPPNIGYLASMKMWMEMYASENDGQIPTLDQLKKRCLHTALKQASSEHHQILVTGRLADVGPNQPLIRYCRPHAFHEFFIHPDGRVTMQPNPALASQKR